jgi:hypothetical protein
MTRPMALGAHRPSSAYGYHGQPPRTIRANSLHHAGRHQSSLDASATKPSHRLVRDRRPIRTGHQVHVRADLIDNNLNQDPITTFAAWDAGIFGRGHWSDGLYQSLPAATSLTGLDRWLRTNSASSPGPINGGTGRSNGCRLAAGSFVRRHRRR